MARDRGSGAALTPALVETCVRVAAAMHDARDHWWIIASAAVALQGVDAGPVGDVDVLASRDDARRFADHCGIELVSGAPSDRFRSMLFGRWTASPLPVEIMAGFEVAGPEGWERVAPATRQQIVLGGATVFVPERAELRAMLSRFARPKDLARAALLTP